MLYRYAPLLALLAFSLSCPHVHAQNFSKRNRYRTAGVSLNALSYFGDISPRVRASSFRAGATRPGLSVHATQRLNPRLSLRAALSYGRLTGQDAQAGRDHDASAQIRYQRNLNFRNDLVELAATGVFDLVENRGDYLRRLSFVPFVFAGVAVFHHSPQGLVGGGTIPAELRAGEYVALQPLRTEGQATGYRRTQVALPFGGGVRYRLTKDLDLSLEIGWRKTFTDYLDDVSRTYADGAKLTSPAARYFGRNVTRTTGPTEAASFAAPGQLRGHHRHDDWYLVTGVSVHYLLPQPANGSKFR